MIELEEMGQAYLFKLRQSAGVKSLIERLWSSEHWHNVATATTLSRPR